MAEDTSYKNEYDTNFKVQFQQMGPRLPQTCIQTSHSGEYGYEDRINAIDLDNTNTDEPGRKQDTQWFDVDYDRRRVTATENRWSTLRRKADVVKQSGNPNSAIIVNAVAHMQKLIDKKIINGATGSAYGGKEGATENTFDTSNQRVAANWLDGGASGSNTNLTAAKLRRSFKILHTAEAVMDGEPVFCIVNAATLDGIMREVETTSVDYTNAKLLTTGQARTADFLGLTFVRSELLNYSSGTIARVLMYPRSAIRYSVQEGFDLTTEIQEKVATKNFDTAISVSKSDGAVREWEEKVNDILCEETA